MVAATALQSISSFKLKHSNAETKAESPQFGLTLVKPFNKKSKSANLPELSQQSAWGIPVSTHRHRHYEQDAPITVKCLDQLSGTDRVTLNALKENLRKNTVSVYGSARTKPGDGYYEHAQKVGEAMAKAGLSVVTGGGPGAMRAVAEGAFRFPVNVLGMAMSFIGEEHSQDVHKVMRHFNNFFDRLDNFESEAALTACVPGGIGSLMELTNIATKLDTGNTPYPLQKQMILFDRNNMFRDLKQHLQENFVKKGFMSQRVLDMMVVVNENEIDKGVALLKANKEFTKALA